MYCLVNFCDKPTKQVLLLSVFCRWRNEGLLSHNNTGTKEQETYNPKYVSCSSAWTFNCYLVRSVNFIIINFTSVSISLLYWSISIRPIRWLKISIPGKVGIAYASGEISILRTNGWATKVELLLACLNLFRFFACKSLNPLAFVYYQFISAKERGFIHSTSHPNMTFYQTARFSHRAEMEPLLHEKTGGPGGNDYTHLCVRRVLQTEVGI